MNDRHIKDRLYKYLLARVTMELILDSGNRIGYVYANIPLSILEKRPVMKRKRWKDYAKALYCDEKSIRRAAKTLRRAGKIKWLRVTHGVKVWLFDTTRHVGTVREFTYDGELILPTVESYDVHVRVVNNPDQYRRRFYG